jgi:hypothetical protein
LTSLSKDPQYAQQVSFWSILADGIHAASPEGKEHPGIDIDAHPNLPVIFIKGGILQCPEIKL